VQFQQNTVQARWTDKRTDHNIKMTYQSTYSSGCVAEDNEVMISTKKYFEKEKGHKIMQVNIVQA
jgi:hypothetical protein